MDAQKTNLLINPEPGRTAIERALSAPIQPPKLTKAMLIAASLGLIEERRTAGASWAEVAEQLRSAGLDVSVGALRVHVSAAKGRKRR